jgi:hypothetical protein
MEHKEYRRGAKSAREYFSKFRSFKRDNQGRVVGYKKSGSTEVIGKSYSARGTDPFFSGWHDEQRRIIKSKPVRRARPQRRNAFGISRNSIFSGSRRRGGIW